MSAAGRKPTANVGNLDTPRPLANDGNGCGSTTANQVPSACALRWRKSGCLRLRMLNRSVFAEPVTGETTMLRANFRRSLAALTALATLTMLTLAAVLSLPALAADPHPVVGYSKQGKFEDVRDDLKSAIEGKGLVIDYQSHVNDMLERTGKDVGSTRKLYQNAQGFVFCSASLSRKMMEADVANISMCPYTMIVYATAQEPAKVHVTYKRPWRPDGSAASKAALKEVEAMLDGIARQAIGIK
jgi:uncharacterized protein (DUF302 family)